MPGTVICDETILAAFARCFPEDRLGRSTECAAILADANTRVSPDIILILFTLCLLEPKESGCA
jgi:hypothetical protein